MVQGTEISEEAKAILEYFGDTKGRFLDIGAGGVPGGVTYPLAQAGWSGVCVEAGGVNAARLAEAYKDNSRVTVIQGLMKPKHGIYPFWTAKDRSLSTGSGRLQALGGEREGAVEAYHAAVTIEDILPYQWGDCHGVYEVVSIDVEDKSIEVMDSLPFSRMGTRLLCIEYYSSILFGEDEETCIKNIGARTGFYNLTRTEENLILVRE
jgi:hypothetical protein